jgi:hypothetical protein
LELQSDHLSKYASVSTTNQLLPVSRPRVRISSCSTRREQMTLDNQRPGRLLGRALATLGSACLARKRPIFSIFLSPRGNPIAVSGGKGDRAIAAWWSCFVNGTYLAENRPGGRLTGIWRIYSISKEPDERIRGVGVLIGSALGIPWRQPVGNVSNFFGTRAVRRPRIGVW